MFNKFLSLVSEAPKFDMNRLEYFHNKCQSFFEFSHAAQTTDATYDCALSNEMATRRKNIEGKCNEIKIQFSNRTNSKLDALNMFPVLRAGKVQELPRMDTSRLYVFKNRLV